MTPIRAHGASNSNLPANIRFFIYAAYSGLWAHFGAYSWQEGKCSSFLSLPGQFFEFLPLIKKHGHACNTCNNAIRCKCVNPQHRLQHAQNNACQCYFRFYSPLLQHPALTQLQQFATSCNTPQQVSTCQITARKSLYWAYPHSPVVKAFAQAAAALPARSQAWRAAAAPFPGQL